MGLSYGVERQISQMWSNLEAIMDTDRIMTSESHRGHQYFAAEFSTNAASEVIITPTTTSSEVIVLAFRISTAGASGIVQLESSSTSVGYGGVIAKV